MKRRRGAVVLALLAGCGTPAAAPRTDAARSAAVARVEAAANVIRRLTEGADGGFPQTVARNARCVAIVPALVHAGLLIGARAGRGVVSCRDPVTRAWRDPAFFTVSGASAGLQAGASSIDLVMLAMTSTTETGFLSRNLQIGAGTSFAVGPVGRNAQASSDVGLQDAILYYSRSQGLFVGLDLAGTSLEADEEASRAFYGDARDLGILLRGPRAIPPVAALLSRELTRAFPP